MLNKELVVVFFNLPAKWKYHTTLKDDKSTVILENLECSRQAKKPCVLTVIKNKKEEFILSAKVCRCNGSMCMHHAGGNFYFYSFIGNSTNLKAALQCRV